MICPACLRELPARVVVDAATVVDLYELRITDERMQKVTEPVLFVCVERTAPPKEPTTEHTARQPA